MHKHDGDTHHHNSNTLFQGCDIPPRGWLQKSEKAKKGGRYPAHATDPLGSSLAGNGMMIS
jgi:hypothetical protein